jgi:hypothetical protein
MAGKAKSVTTEIAENAERKEERARENGKININ